MRPAPDGSLWAEYALHKSMIFKACGTYGSGGVIRNSRNLNFHDIFFGHDSSKRARKAVGRRRIKVSRGN